jgi:histone arginine demethylase JMJD6
MKIDIERRVDLSYAEFAEKYQYANKPVIVTDALRQWKALERWTPEFFKREFSDLAFSIGDDSKGSARCKADNGSTQYTMASFIDRVLESTDDNPAPYFRNRVLYEMFPSLRQDIEPLPEYFQPNWLPDRYLLRNVGNVLNRGAAIEIYIGGRGGKFPMLHYDGAAAHAFLMQIYGRKQFILYSPDQEPLLYPSPEKGNLSLINSVDKPDLEKFPLFAKAVPTSFVLEPGELLFIPSRWWHTTKILTPCISISVNTVNQSNWPALVKFVAAGRRNPVVSMASRIYLTGAGVWRSWRDREWRNPNRQELSNGTTTVSPR